jgi:transcriptional regulator with XRE-family HTH domain
VTARNSVLRLYRFAVDSVTRSTKAFMEALVGVLRDERERSGLSQTELASKAGLSRPHVGYLETGERQPSVESLKRLALALGTTAAELVSRAEERAKKR